MAKKSVSPPPAAERDAAPGGAAAVDRALNILGAFRSGDMALTLVELAGRTQLYKSTVLRLLASLEHADLMQRMPDGRYQLGPEVARLHAIYMASFSIEAQLLPVMRQLVDATQESVAFHVRQGEHRLCLLRIDSPHPLRDHVRAGDVLPLDRGAGGRVLMAYAGAKGRLYDEIRREGFVLRSGDRVEGVIGISAPVWAAAGTLAGALTLTLPEQRMRPAFVAALRSAALAATHSIGGSGEAAVNEFSAAAPRAAGR